MKILAMLLASVLLLGGCGNPNKVADGTQANAASPAGKDQRSQFLAYVHTISVDTNEDAVRPLYDKVIAACKADVENACVLLDSSMEGGRQVYARIGVRAKPEGVRKLIVLVAQQGQPVSQGTQAQDLGRPIFDSNKRLEMLKQYQAKLSELERRSSNDIESLIKISKELASVQSELEQTTADNAQLLQRVNTDLLNITISARSGRSMWKPVGRSLDDFGNNLAQGISSAIFALAYILPWSLCLLVLFLFGRFIWRKLRGWRRGKGA